MGVIALESAVPPCEILVMSKMSGNLELAFIGMFSLVFLRWSVLSLLYVCPVFSFIHISSAWRARMTLGTQDASKQLIS